MNLLLVILIIIIFISYVIINIIMISSKRSYEAFIKALDRYEQENHANFLNNLIDYNTIYDKFDYKIYDQISKQIDFNTYWKIRSKIINLTYLTKEGLYETE